VKISGKETWEKLQRLHYMMQDGLEKKIGKRKILELSSKKLKIQSCYFYGIADSSCTGQKAVFPAVGSIPRGEPINFQNLGREVSYPLAFRKRRWRTPSL